MLETIHEFAVEQLDASGEVMDLRLRHAEFFLALAEEAGPRVSAEPRHWMPQLEPEMDNFRAAMDHLEATRDAEAALRITAALGAVWYRRGHVAEGRWRLESALEMEQRSTVLRGRALGRLAALLTMAGEDALATSMAQEALGIGEAQGDTWTAAFARHVGGVAAAGLGELTTAQAVFEESVEAFQALGDEHQTMVATRALAWVSDELGDRERYLVLTHENLERARRLGNEPMEARALGALALDATYEGRGLEVVGDLKRVLTVDHEVREGVMTGVDVLRFAFAVAAADPAVSARLIAAADAHVEELLGSRLYESWANEMRDAALEVASLSLDASTLESALAAGRSMTIDDAITLALEWGDSAPAADPPVADPPSRALTSPPNY